MNRFRIAVAAALVLAAGFAGGATHASRQAPARPAAAASEVVVEGPVLCCN
jgi:hypothetical protein